jgi:uncharacterized protein with PIN domain
MSLSQTAFFRFFQSLNDFLPRALQEKQIDYAFEGTPAIKDAIEAIGIPHTEVDIVIVNNAAVNFTYKLYGNDIVQVYPANANVVVSKEYSLIPDVNFPLAFIADVHLGKLTKTLRILGFDTLFNNQFSDTTIAEIAEKEQRIILTRDVGLLKRKSIKWGYWLRSQVLRLQLKEVINRYNLLPKILLFTRCLSCNGKIEEVSKEMVKDQIPPNTVLYFEEFYQCTCCKKIYWKGSHYENMLDMVKSIYQSID